MNLAGRTVVITGGASGLGRATARLMVLGHGARAALFDLPGSAGGALAAELVQAGGHAAFVPVDVADEGSVAAAVAAAREIFGTIDVCVNCAGIPGSMRLLDRDGRPAHGAVFRRTLAVNLEGTFNVMAHCAAVMRGNPSSPDGERGVIINVASIAATDGTLGHVAYSASKAGIIGMMLPAARELADHGIRVLSIAPGLFETPMAGSVPPRALKRMTDAMVFPRRFGDPAEFAAAVVHLCENAYLNGTTIRLDGAQRL